MIATYLQHAGDDLIAVNAARVSFGKTKEVLDDKDIKLISYLANNQHFAPFEHCSATLHLRVPLFVTAQIQRHRTFSYSQISRRYVKDNLEFYWPEKWRKAAANVKQGSSDDVWDEGVIKGWAMFPRELVEYAVQTFEAMIAQGCCPEQARMILPQNLMTEFYMTGNLRNWCHFLKLRLDPHAQKECRDIAEQIALIIEPLFPHSYQALMNTDA